MARYAEHIEAEKKSSSRRASFIANIPARRAEKNEAANGRFPTRAAAVKALYAFEATHADGAGYDVAKVDGAWVLADPFGHYLTA